jgi:CO/xanthine dehydrogenase Mo-binding subunit
MLHCAMLRSPYAHARIKGVDTSEAEKLPGVVAVITGVDAQRWSRPATGVPPGWCGHCLATDRVRFVGEPVAAVAATSRYIAEDALELIEVDYEPLPAVVDPVKAMASDSSLLFEEHGTNVMFQRDFKWGEVDRAFEEADHVFTETFRWNRMGANPIENFGVVSVWDPVEGSVVMRGGFQAPSTTALGLSSILGLPLSKVRLIPHPHGGAFGGKAGFRGMEVSVLLSRKAGGRPVKWTEDRMEYMLAGSSQAWDRDYEVSLAVKKDGTVTGLKVKLLDNLGATGEGCAAVGAIKPMACFTGCYAIPVAEYDFSQVATNKVPCGAYRGMGPPPHTFALEQMMDIAARGLGMDPAEIRRKNFIPPDRFPYTIASGNEYDSGNYEAALDQALEMADYPSLRKEQAEARKEGRYLGIGVANAIEPGVFDYNLFSVMGWGAGTGPPEGVTLSIDLMGKIVIKVGFTLEGQGQFTVAAQVAADYFGLELEDVLVVTQDTHSAPPHYGQGGSRLGVAMTGAILGAAGQLKDKLVKVAQAAREGRGGCGAADGPGGRDHAHAERPAAPRCGSQSGSDRGLDGCGP